MPGESGNRSGVPPRAHRVGVGAHRFKPLVRSAGIGQKTTHRLTPGAVSRANNHEAVLRFTHDAKLAAAVAHSLPHGPGGAEVAAPVETRRATGSRSRHPPRRAAGLDISTRAPLIPQSRTTVGLGALAGDNGGVRVGPRFSPGSGVAPRRSWDGFWVEFSGLGVRCVGLGSDVADAAGSPGFDPRRYSTRRPGPRRRGTRWARRGRG